eukprot:1641261-Pleurochrysis_carterae.AAC.1
MRLTQSKLPKNSGEHARSCDQLHGGVYKLSHKTINGPTLPLRPVYRRRTGRGFRGGCSNL